MFANAAALTPAKAQAVEPGIPSPQDAPIAMLVDITSGQVLHARRPGHRFVPASITKAMTMFHAFELMEEGTLDPQATFTLRPDTWREWAGRGSTMWLGAGDRVRVDSLLTGIANVSANDGAATLAEGQAGSIAAWTAGMNARARAIGMTDSHFATPNGWSDEGLTFTTARDLVTLAEAMVTRHPRRFARYIGHRSFAYGGIRQFNYDPLIGRTRGADGIKTGYTNEAGFGYLGTAMRDGQRLVLVVAGAPSKAARDRAARAYVEWGFEAFETELLFARGQRVAHARVQRGEARSVALRAPRDLRVNVPRGRSGDLALSVRYDGPLVAPIAPGDRVANLVVEVPGLDAARFPLEAAEAVPEAGPFARVLNALAGWFS